MSASYCIWEYGRDFSSLTSEAGSSAASLASSTNLLLRTWSAKILSCSIEPLNAEVALFIAELAAAYAPSLASRILERTPCAFVET